MHFNVIARVHVHSLDDAAQWVDGVDDGIIEVSELLLNDGAFVRKRDLNVLLGANQNGARVRKWVSRADDTSGRAEGEAKTQL